MRSVAITGISGYLGRALLGLLDTDPSITRIVGIDLAEPGITGRNLEFYSMDVRAPELADVLRGCDTVVHLAALSKGSDLADARDTNVGGTRSVVDAASRAGVRKLIFASSHRVYGAHADNDFPLTESSSVRPNHEDAFAVSKAEAETIVSYFASEHPDATVTTLRFAFVAGPSIPTSHASLIDANIRIVVPGYETPLQVLHEQDAAQALHHAVTNDLAGTFNVAPDDSVDAPEALLGQRRVEIDLDKAKRIAEKTSQVGVTPIFGPQLYPQVISNDALRNAGFAPKHSSAEALRQAAEARREWVSVGRFRLRRRSAVMVAGTVGALALVALRGRTRRVRG